jgi:hypothetical protein
MTCREFIDALGGYLAGELGGEAQGEADLHLKVCGDCVQYLKSYEVTIRLGRAAFGDEEPEKLPGDLVEVILSAVPRTKKR